MLLGEKCGKMSGSGRWFWYSDGQALRTQILAYQVSLEPDCLAPTEKATFQVSRQREGDHPRAAEVLGWTSTVCNEMVTAAE